MTLEQRTDYGGIIRDARWWATSAGYEFQVVFGHADHAVAVMSATNDGTDGYGWADVGGIGTLTEGSTGDLLSSADVDPTRWTVTIVGRGKTSPRIFGSYDHALQASRFLGYFPTKLTLEYYGRWSTNSTNQTTTFVGLAGPAVTDCAAAGSAGGIRSGGTASTFFLTSDNGSDAGAAIDTAYHLWRIEYGLTNTEWFIDNVSQGTITTEADIWPQAFRMQTGSNNVEIAWARVFYS